MAFEHSNLFKDPTNFTVTLTLDVSDRVNAKGIPARETLLNCLQDAQQMLSDGIKAVQQSGKVAQSIDEQITKLQAEKAKLVALEAASGSAAIIAEKQAAIDAEKAAEEVKKAKP